MRRCDTLCPMDSDEAATLGIRLDQDETFTLMNFLSLLAQGAAAITRAGPCRRGSYFSESRISTTSASRWPRMMASCLPS
jgi:hypothetical protein